MPEKSYHPQEIESYWQRKWESADLFRADVGSSRPKYYVLEMLPYPSGTLHMGHVRNYAIGDALARYKWMRGYHVLHPMGWDSFGLPAENAAIQNKRDPSEWTRTNIAEMKRQHRRFGFSYDWSMEISTCEPEYYRWNQWFFLKMYERDLAYRRKAQVNWCPECMTVLANEQVVDGCCWRHEKTPVENRDLDQWFLRITNYADQLLDDHSQLVEGWPERVLTMQRNWIGRSKGTRIDFILEGSNEKITVFTTRVDTIFGATCIILAPEYPLVKQFGLRAEAQRLIQSRMINTTNMEKKGIFTGRFAINPYSGDKIQIWIGNFVLMDYGTGAIMAVPAHDERDFEFCKKYGMPIRPVIRSIGGKLADASTMDEAFSAYGVLENSGEFSGLATTEAIKKMNALAVKKGFGEAAITYRLKDWGISRQRYWGTPIPMIHCPKCGVVPVPEDQLPVLLPSNVNLTGTGESPLKAIPEFANVECPKCGCPAQRECDTMDTFIDSSWYFYRYCDAKNNTAPFSSKGVATWFPIDQYIGGIEHAVLHLIYCRFFTKVIRDLGLITWDEPVKCLFTQGMVIREGAKMSKSKGNVVNPDAYLDRYGADTVRVFSLFAAPPDKDLDWLDGGVDGMYRFLGRLYRLVTRHVENTITPSSTPKNSADRAVLQRLHQTIEKVTSDFESRWHFNTSLASVMELTNEIYAFENDLSPAVMREVLLRLVLLMGPFAPYVVEELWQELGQQGPVLRTQWPEADPKLACQHEIEVPVQVNGKLRSRLTVARGTSREELEQLARSDPKVVTYLKDKLIRKVVVVLDKLVNVVVD